MYTGFGLYSQPAALESKRHSPTAGGPGIGPATGLPATRLVPRPGTAIAAISTANTIKNPRPRRPTNLNATPPGPGRHLGCHLP